MDHYTTVPGAGIGGHGMGKSACSKWRRGRGPLPFPGGQSFLLHRTAHLGSQPLDPSQSFPRRGKDRLLPSPLSIGQRQCLEWAWRRSSASTRPCWGGKVGKPIQIHVLTLEKRETASAFPPNGSAGPGGPARPGRSWPHRHQKSGPGLGASHRPIPRSPLPPGSAAPPVIQ